MLFWLIASMQYSPAPMSAPIVLADAPGYFSTCTVRAESGGEPFAVSIAVKPKGARRIVEVISGAPNVVPSGKGKSDGMRRYAGPPAEALRESFRVDDTSGLLFSHRSAVGASVSTISMTYLKLNEPIRTVASGTCTVQWRAK